MAELALVDKLTDEQVYTLYLRAHDKEAEAEDQIRRMEAEAEDKDLDRKRDEFLAMCRDFGIGEHEAQTQWAAWLREQ